MIGKDTSLTENEREYFSNTVETLENEIFTDGLGSKHFDALDNNEESRADWAEYVRRMGEHDLIGIAIPETVGGPGGSFVETVLAEQAIGYCGTIVHACQTSLTQHIGHTMYQHGAERVKETYLKPMLNGELIVSQAYTEPSSGTDIARVDTTAEQDGDEWILEGQKRFIDFAKYGDLYFLPARTSGEDGEREGISLFVVDGDADGIEIIEDQSDWHGFRGTGAAWMAFDGVRVPDLNLVGEEGGAWPYITDELNLEHLTVSRYCLGASQKALEIAADYTENREVNEQPISDYQGVNHKIAEMATKLDAAYLMNTRAARMLDESGISAGRMEGSMAKWYGNDLAHEIADTCIQVMGGIATTDKYPVERIQRDVRAGRFLGGASEVMKSVVQHYAYKSLSSGDFNPDYVGNELNEEPWIDLPSLSASADDD